MFPVISLLVLTLLIVVVDILQRLFAGKRVIKILLQVLRLVIFLGVYAFVQSFWKGLLISIFMIAVSEIFMTLFGEKIDIRFKSKFGEKK